eukprot:6382367-Pyramimonas_sp.AAC.2
MDILHTLCKRASKALQLTTEMLRASPPGIYGRFTRSTVEVATHQHSSASCAVDSAPSAGVLGYCHFNCAA